MSKFKMVVAFLVGTLFGVTNTWYFMKKVFERRSEQDIASIKESYHAHEEKLKAELEEFKEQLDTDSSMQEDSSKTEELYSNALRQYSSQHEKENIVEYTRGKKYLQYDPPKSDENNSGSSTYKMDAPYVISPEDFGEFDDYTQVSLTYFADGVLADEQGVIIDDVEEIIGDALEHFGEYEADSVFCRSDPKRCDYEILQDLRRYTDVRKSFPPNR